MTHEMFAKRFLAERSLDFESLARTVPPMRGRQVLLLSGSIAYGLANKESDIDLLVLSDEALDPRDSTVVSYKEFDAWNVRVNGQDVNIEVFGLNAVRNVAERHAQMLRLLDDPAATKRLESFSEGELQLLSRLRDGIVLANPEAAQFWRDQMRLEAFPLYLIVKSVSEHLIAREDAIGQYEQGELETALAISMQSIVELCIGLLASVGETCMKHKWQLRLLRRQEEAIGGELVDAIVQARFPDVRRADEEIKRAIALANRIVSQISQRKPEVAEMLATINARFRLTTRIASTSSAAQ